jgi:hypothetical protein
MNEALENVADQATSMVETVSAELDRFVNERVPCILTNAEYATATSALMISLNRQLARCAAAFGEAQGIDPNEMIQLVAAQFDRNYARCLDVIRHGNGRLQ